MGVDQEFDQDIMRIHGISSSNEIYSWSENMVPHNGWSSCFAEIASVFCFSSFSETPQPYSAVIRFFIRLVRHGFCRLWLAGYLGVSG